MMPDQEYKKASDGEQYYSKEIPTESEESIARRCMPLCPTSFQHFLKPILPLVCTELTSAQQSLLGMPGDGNFRPLDVQQSERYREDIANTTRGLLKDEALS